MLPQSKYRQAVKWMLLLCPLPQAPKSEALLLPSVEQPPLIACIPLAVITPLFSRVLLPPLLIDLLLPPPKWREPHLQSATVTPHPISSTPLPSRDQVTRNVWLPCLSSSDSDCVGVNCYDDVACCTHPSDFQEATKELLPPTILSIVSRSFHAHTCLVVSAVPSRPWDPSDLYLWANYSGLPLDILIMLQCAYVYSSAFIVFCKYWWLVCSIWFDGACYITKP